MQSIGEVSVLSNFVIDLESLPGLYSLLWNVYNGLEQLNERNKKKTVCVKICYRYICNTNYTMKWCFQKYVIVVMKRSKHVCFLERTGIRIASISKIFCWTNSSFIHSGGVVAFFFQPKCLVTLFREPQSWSHRQNILFWLKMTWFTKKLTVHFCNYTFISECQGSGEQIKSLKPGQIFFLHRCGLMCVFEIFQNLQWWK